MIGWHHELEGHESEQAPGDGEGQGGLECCHPLRRKELDTTEPLNNNCKQGTSEFPPVNWRFQWLLKGFLQTALPVLQQLRPLLPDVLRAPLPVPAGREAVRPGESREWGDRGPEAACCPAVPASIRKRPAPGASVFTRGLASSHEDPGTGAEPP